MFSFATLLPRNAAIMVSFCSWVNMTYSSFLPEPNIRFVIKICKFAVFSQILAVRKPKPISSSGFSPYLTAVLKTVWFTSLVADLYRHPFCLVCCCFPFLQHFCDDRSNHTVNSDQDEDQGNRTGYERSHIASCVRAAHTEVTLNLASQNECKH